MARRLFPLALAVLSALATSACVLLFDSEAADSAGDDDVAPPSQCFVDEDCLLAGPTCCDCPSYALPLSSGWGDTCANVDCPMPGPMDPGACTPLVARCELGACIATCAPVACDMSCAEGFLVDANGCLTCACNQGPALPTCMQDSDCVEVPADCCGCARGGIDTAVPASIAQEYVDSLMCPPDPTLGACPDVDTCEPGRVPRCRDYQCALVGPNDPGWPEPPPGACGRPDLPPCPTGQVCVLNQNSDAGPLGLGVCQPAP